MSSAERFRRVDELFRAATRLPPEERKAFLDAECASDPTLKDEVLELLSRDHAPTGGLDRPALGQEIHLSEFARPGQAPAPTIPERIGHYRVVGKIGEGGMGVVYEAEQESPRRTVALKVIHSGVSPASRLRRLEHEAEVLGKLQHPGIAQVYEAGTFDAGAGPQPFFAMEFIRGRPITEHVTINNLSTRERLDLITLVCDAVQHAHQRGIIHRDLKPANILVDEAGQPKILDFGVARATDGDVQTTTLRTDVGQLVGTIAYMSPEQAAGDPDELDTRSDVYALGVVAYQLLAGRVPFDLRRKVIHEAVRVIREETPRPLSSFSRVLRGDVETIIGKALLKDKNRRYQSAAALSEDIRRYLNNEPIAARPPSAWYQVRKFAGRNRTLVGAAAAVLLVLVAAVVVSGMFAVREGRARVRMQDALELAESRRVEVERQSRIARAVNAFLTDDLLAAADPTNSRDRDITVRTVLDQASAGIGGRFEEQPLVEASIRATLGRAYMELTEYDAAIPHLERALEMTRDELGDDARTLAAMNDVSMIYMDTARFDDAERVLEDAVALGRRLPEVDEALHVDTLCNLASVYYKQGRLDDAAGVFEEAADVGRRLLPDHPSTLSALASLALVYQRTGRRAEAEPISLEAVEAYERVHGPEHPYTLTARNNLAMLYADDGRFDVALPLFLDVLETRRRTLGDEHTDTLVSMGTLARAYRQAGRYEESEAVAVPCCEAMRRKLGPDHPYTKISFDIVIELYEAWGRPDDAAAWRRRQADLGDSTSVPED